MPDESRIVNITPEIIEAVPITRTINEKALSSNITINALDIGAASIEQGNKADSAIQSIQGNGKIIQPDFNRSVVITPENIGAVPVERCVAPQDMSRRGARAGYVALKFYTNN